MIHSIKGRAVLALLPLAILAMGAAPTLFSKPEEIRWSVNVGSTSIATITLMAKGPQSRLEWRKQAGKPATVFIASDNKIWVRSAGGAVELSAYPGGLEKEIAPALLLPTLSSAADKVTLKAGKVATYQYGEVKATYQYGPTGLLGAVEIIAKGRRYNVQSVLRKALASEDSSLFALRPKTDAQIMMARRRLAGDLFTSSDTSVPATAGGRGVEKGFQFADGGNYAALQALETRDESWKKNLNQALSEFQDEGMIGKAKGDQR